jgi:D-3-phosphoglycerate dehydrogenase
MVADRARVFGMRIIANDPFVSEEAALRAGAELVDMERLLSESDYITIQTARNERTKNLIDREVFSKMKRGMRVVNLTGGGVLNEAALLWAIEEGIVSGAALDAFTVEPPDNIALLKNEKIILTPHIGGDTEEAYDMTSEALAEQLIGHYRDGIIINPLNFPAMGDETLKTVGPFLELGRKLGRFTGQILTSKKVKKIEIGYMGKVETFETRLISLHILKELLSFVTQKNIRVVNAFVRAKEYGIKVEEETSTSFVDYSSEITITVSGDGWKRLVSGAIVGNSPRIVKIDNYFIEAIPEGTIILVSNDDLPGVVGSIGTSLGFAQVNIGRMQLARDTELKKNLILINVDSPVEDTILELLRKLPNVNEVSQIEL